MDRDEDFPLRTGAIYENYTKGGSIVCLRTNNTKIKEE